jgi:proline iminopeptidase
MRTRSESSALTPRTGSVPVEGAALFTREIGRGQPLLVLHGGPDFDHHYLLPDLDRLADGYRLIYYDQRGRGLSGEGVGPEDITLASDIADIDRVREHFGLDSVAVLGHSWGGVLAMEYAIRHPERVSHLVLMGPGPASSADYQFLRAEGLRNEPDVLARLKKLGATKQLQSGDLEADAGYYLVHFGNSFRSSEHLERLLENLRVGATPAGIRMARAIEDRLMDETWLAPGYDLFPALARLSVPTLVLHGDRDLIPLACAEHIAAAIPGAKLVVLPNTGHFPYIERPAEVRRVLDAFFEGRETP